MSLFDRYKDPFVYGIHEIWKWTFTLFFLSLSFFSSSSSASLLVLIFWIATIYFTICVGLFIKAVRVRPMLLLFHSGIVIAPPPFIHSFHCPVCSFFYFLRWLSISFLFMCRYSFSLLYHGTQFFALFFSTSPSNSLALSNSFILFAMFCISFYSHRFKWFECESTIATNQGRKRIGKVTSTINNNKRKFDKNSSKMCGKQKRSAETECK